MNRLTRCALLAIAFALLLPTAWAQAPSEHPRTFPLNPDPAQARLPSDVILVPGAMPSSSDPSMPVPETGVVGKTTYDNRYFGLSFPIPADWTEKVKGPPPSDSGSYVLGLLVPSETIAARVKGSILITAQDLFFTLTPATNAAESVSYMRQQLPSYHQMERAPAELTIGAHTFARFDYGAPLSGLHWVVVATEVRCHVVQFTFMSRDPAVLASMVESLKRVQLPEQAGATTGQGGGDTPLCIADYATPDHLLERVEPNLSGRKFNAIPARIIIDKEGRVKHVHLLSAFPDQSAAITDAVLKWRFKPLLRAGRPVEVETGIVFGRTPLHQPAAGTKGAVAKQTE